MLLKKYFLVLFFLLQIIFVQFLKFYPSIIETYYSNRLFLIISKFSRTLLGKISISVGDLIYLIFIIYIVTSIWNTRNKWKVNWKVYVLKTVNFLCIFYFLFYFLWGLNYYRQPLFEKINISKEYSNQDLYSFIDKLITKTNQIQYKITKNKYSKVILPFDDTQLLMQTKNGYDILSKKYSFFKYETTSIKGSLYSTPLSYMGFSGYLNPFTNEAQYNSKVPKYSIPMTVCHEMAHQIGYASESECNFIGYLAADFNDDLYFKYSANTLALKYCLRTIQLEDAVKAKFYLNKINAGIILNFREDNQFYEKYHSFIETGFEIFYDNFLKLNQQKEGMESYSKFVDLLINFDKNI